MWSTSALSAASISSVSVTRRARPHTTTGHLCKDRWVEGRAGQDQAVDQGHGDADVHVRAQAEPAPGGAVQVQRLPDPGVAGGDDVRLAVDHEPDVADEALVEDGVDGGPVV